ncbi:MAG: mechanosensitive ion channel family protein [Myxococcota bacterium]
MSARGAGLVLVVACGLASLSAAQTTPEQARRATPRESVLAYLEACRAGDYVRAADSLDLRAIPPAQRPSRGPRLARHLKVVLDRELWVDVDALSTAPEGDPDDGLPPGRDRVGEIETPQGSVPIQVARHAGQWRIDRRTVAQIEPLYSLYGYGPLGDYIPAPLFEIRILELELWQWIGLIAAVTLAYLAAMAVSLVVSRAAARFAATTATDIDDRLLRAASGPLTATLSVALFYPLTLPLGLSVPVRSRIAGLCTGLVIVAAVWLALRLIDLGTELIRSHLIRRGNPAATGLLPVARRLTKVFLGAIAGLSLLDNLGFDVTGLLAGLGIGGLAVALAAQKTFENFLGSMELIGDRPVSVGDFCRFGDKVGTVEDIGLRSVRIRTLDRTLVTIPNSQFASLSLENFGARDRIRFSTTLGLRYETTAEQLRHVLVELKKLLAAHPRVDPDPARVRFVGFGAYSLDLEIYAYVQTSDWAEFLAIREDLLLRIMERVEASGSGFAFPSQTLYLGRDEGLDADRARSAEEAVRGWRERGLLPLPDPTPGMLEEERASLPWPPEGSVQSPGRPGRSR